MFRLLLCCISWRFVAQAKFVHCIIKSFCDVIFCLWYLSRDFCRKVCDVPEPEVRFNINEYSDFVNPTKPIVFISVKEIIDTHAVSFITSCTLIYVSFLFKTSAFFKLYMLNILFVRVKSEKHWHTCSEFHSNVITFSIL